MPRDSQGLYSLPAGNPVSPGTLIEAAWANTTMSDVAQALTDSLPRNGAAPMVGPLTLVAGAPTAARHATSKAYVDSFVAYSTGMPIGSIVAYAAGTTPGGFLLCNGQAVSRTTYAALFALIGTSFGAGDGVNTFNVPNLTDYFIRARNPATRAVGSTQSAAFAAHNHGVNDPGHIHAVTDPKHAHPQEEHTHIATQAAHSHSYSQVGTPGNGFSYGNGAVPSTVQTGSQQPVITVDPAQPSVELNATGITVNSNTTGISTASTGDSETRPQNIAFDYYIKALQDSAATPGVATITSADTQVLQVDASISVSPILVPQTNIANGMAKLDSNAKIYAAQMPFTALNYQGPWDASTGQTPSEAFPTTTFIDGDMYQVAVQGTLTVYDSTGTLAPVICAVGSQLVYMTNSPTLPVPGWYYNPPLTLGAVGAAQVSFTPFPAGGIGATNVQLAIEEVATERVPLNGTGATGTWGISISGNAATATNATNATTAASCSGNSATATNATNATTAASCTGNSATATTAAACSGNSATATVANYAKQVPVSVNTGPSLVAADNGKCVVTSANITAPAATFAAGDAVSVFNDSASPITLTQGVGLTLRLGGTVTTGNRTIAAYGMATLWYATPGVAVVTGSGVT